MWHLNDDGAIPPLPERILQKQEPVSQKGGRQEAWPEEPTHLKPGCWVVLLDPVFGDDAGVLKTLTVVYDGTLRVDKMGRASGDLYLRRQDWSKAPDREKGPPELEKPKSFPIFPLRGYAFYFTLRSIHFDQKKFKVVKEVKIDTFRYDPATSTWGPPETLTALPTSPDPKDIPADWVDAEPGDYQCWSIVNDRATNVGRLQMGRITGPDHLREARIEFAQAENVKAPLDNGYGLTVQKVFEKLGWKVEVVPPVVVQGPPDLWEVNQLHAKMLELRSPAKLDLDHSWTYHVLVVPRWQNTEEDGFGLMYDSGALDTNMVPREGIVVAAHAKFPKENFGGANGKMLQDVSRAAFHNVMHELGHAMGLLHRFHGRTFMQGLIYIAAQTPNFPDSLDFEYDAEDELRLLHFPDIWVRPGGAPFGQGYSALPIPDADAITDVNDQFELTVRPVRRSVPLGAPVKLQLRLTNISGTKLPGPSQFGLSVGSVAGRVIRPGGQPQAFSGASPLDDVQTLDLEPGTSLYHGETLLRGPQGPLFPEPGRYRIEVEAGWVSPGGIALVTGYCEILVTQPRNRQHERVALQLLRSQDLSILLVFRPEPDSEHPDLRKALAVLQRALETPELRGSFGPFEARRVVSFGLQRAARLIDESALMTTSEIKDLLDAAGKVSRVARQNPEVRRMLEICRDRALRAVCRKLAPDSLFEQAEELLR
jgi:hypothetical protein